MHRRKHRNTHPRFRLKLHNTMYPLIYNYVQEIWWQNHITKNSKIKWLLRYSRKIYPKSLPTTIYPIKSHVLFYQMGIQSQKMHRASISSILSIIEWVTRSLWWYLFEYLHRQIVNSYLFRANFSKEPDKKVQWRENWISILLLKIQI